MNICRKKKGYALSVLMIALLVISIAIIGLIPLLSKKKDTLTNTSAYVKACIADQGASALTTPACVGTLAGLSSGFGKDYESVLYYLSHATYTSAALKVVRASCDDGTGRACDIFVGQCAINPASCDIGGTENDLNYYITMDSSDVVTDGYLGKDYLKIKGADFYLQRMANFNDAVKAVCNADMTSMACDICAETKTQIYNLNSSQRSDFIESTSTYGTEFHDGIVDIVTGNFNERAKHYGGATSDTGYALAVSPDGNYIYVAGQESSDNSTAFADIYMAKLNVSDGTPVWQKHYGGTSNEMTYSIVVSLDGDSLYITGDESSNASGASDIFAIKLNASDGTTVWKKRYGGVGGDTSYSIALSPDDNYLYITGNGFFGVAGGTDVVVMKLNASDGTSVWKKGYGGTQDDYAYYSIAVSSDGNSIYVVGCERSDPAGNYEVLVIKSNASDGTNVWTRRYGGAGTDAGMSIAVSSDGNFIYVAGYESSDPVGNNDVLVMKLNTSDGTSVWKKHYGGAGSDVAYSLAVSSDRNYLYVTGNESSDTAGGGDVLVMKLNESTGATVWKKHYGGASSDGGRMLIPAPDGKYLYVTGNEISDTAGSYDVLVMKIFTTQTSNMGAGWTVDGVDINPALWTADGVAMGAGWTANGVNMGAGWTVDGVDINPALWIADGVAMGAGWTADAVTIGALWTANVITTSYNSGYITTTDFNNITNIVGGIKSCSIAATEPADTKIRGLVSFDGRSNWKKYSGGLWIQEATAAQLAAYDFSTSGNTIAEIQTGLTNLQSLGTSLDFALYMQTDTTFLVTPSIDTITVTFLKER